MTDIVTAKTGSILRIEMNRPAKKNAMTSAMYIALAEALERAANDPTLRVVLWHGAGDAFCAGNDLEDFLNTPPGPEDSPQARLANVFINFDKPLIAAVNSPIILLSMFCMSLKLSFSRSGFGLSTHRTETVVWTLILPLIAFE